jgi:hypothetical protein
MRCLPLVFVVLLAPGKTVELRYRFEKGMVYTETQERDWVMEMPAEMGGTKWKLQFAVTLRRTVLEADENSRPRSERVEVKRFRRIVSEAPDEPVGTYPFSCEGKTFVWRRLGERWGLFDAKGDVTARYPKLVEQLKSLRDARLPGKPVAPGATWSVTAQRFLETAGLPVPTGVQGKALFKLESVKDGVASIPFHFRFTYEKSNEPHEISARGTWRFDPVRGRDVTSEMEGMLKLDGGKKGEGRIKIRRAVTFE